MSILCGLANRVELTTLNDVFIAKIFKIKETKFIIDLVTDFFYYFNHPHHQHYFFILSDEIDGEDIYLRFIKRNFLISLSIMRCTSFDIQDI